MLNALFVLSFKKLLNEVSQERGTLQILKLPLKTPYFWDGGQNYFLSQLRTISKITLDYPTAFMPKRF